MGEPTDVVRYKNDSFNAHDAEEMTRHCSPEVEVEVPGATLRGRKQVAEFFGTLWEAFPDMQVTMPTEVEQGPFVAVQVELQERIWEPCGPPPETFLRPVGTSTSRARISSRSEEG